VTLVAIKLPRGDWFYDPERPLGRPGGFGQVFEGTDEDGNPVAVKRLHLSAQEAAHREMRVSEELAQRDDLLYVMLVLDAGQDADSDLYFLVMPRAEGSLQDEIDSRGALLEGEARDVMLQVAKGLGEVRELVHRDLKPASP
jgi:eukaryotic-like serine/threonine-protein kinase